jgi:hypothetical protein
MKITSKNIPSLYTLEISMLIREGKEEAGNGQN